MLNKRGEKKPSYFYFRITVYKSLAYSRCSEVKRMFFLSNLHAGVLHWEGRLGTGWETDGQHQGRQEDTDTDTQS